MTASANSVLRCGTLAVYVASKNRVKIGAVDDALRQLRTVHPAVPVTGVLEYVQAARLVAVDVLFSC